MYITRGQKVVFDQVSMRTQKKKVESLKRHWVCSLGKVLQTGKGDHELRGPALICSVI